MAGKSFAHHGSSTARWLAATALSVTTHCGAQAIDPTGSHALLGEPLRIEFRARPASDMPRPSNGCLRIEIQHGDTYLRTEELRRELIFDESSGWTLVRVRHHLPVSEPSLQVRVSLLCGAPFTREFHVLADPRRQATLAEAIRRHSRQTPPQSDTASGPSAEPAALYGRQSVSTSAAPGHTPNSPLPSAQRLPSTQATEDSSTQQVEPAHHPQILALSEQLSSLRAAHERTQQSMSSMSVRLAQREQGLSIPWQPAAALVLGIAGLLALRLAHAAWWLPYQRRRATALTLDIAYPTSQPASFIRPEAGLLDDNIAPATIAQPTTAPRSEPPELLFNSDDLDRQLPADADYGDACLDEPSTPGGIPAILSRVDDCCARGYPIAGLMLLEHQLQLSRAKNAWFLLKLLDLYGEMGNQAANHGLVLRQLQALYNVDVQSRHHWRVNEGPDLAAHEKVLAHICSAWTRPDVLSQLSQLLLRPSALPAMSLAAFREALSLHAIAAETHRPNEDQAAFEPYIDWAPQPA